MPDSKLDGVAAAIGEGVRFVVFLAKEGRRQLDIDSSETASLHLSPAGQDQADEEVAAAMACS
jgi:hypothetical protein